MRVRHVFAAPFVITACRASAPPQTIEMTSPPSPPRPPVAIVDAGIPGPPADAHPAGGTAWIRFEGVVCRALQSDGGDEVISCPDSLLPVAPPDRLIRTEEHEKTWCFAVPTDRDDPHEGRVRCPSGGATVLLPAETIVPYLDSRAMFSARTLSCYHEIYANPPYWEPIEHCPPDLLPMLTGGLEPTSEKAFCYYGEVEVSCLPEDLR